MLAPSRERRAAVLPAGPLPRPLWRSRLAGAGPAGRHRRGFGGGGGVRTYVIHTLGRRLLQALAGALTAARAAGGVPAERSGAFEELLLPSTVR